MPCPSHPPWLGPIKTLFHCYPFTFCATEHVFVRLIWSRSFTGTIHSNIILRTTWPWMFISNVCSNLTELDFSSNKVSTSFIIKTNATASGTQNLMFRYIQTFR
jgi:hypothetical protein